MSLEVVTNPTIEPVALQDAKDYCRVTHSDDDDLIDALITLAREQVEIATNRRILTTVLKYTLDKFPYWMVGLPGGKIQTINTFTYLDKDAATQTVSATLYDSQLNKTPAIILRKSGYSWPTVYENGNAVIINYDAGWATISEVPPNIIMAIKALVNFYYRNRSILANEAIRMPSFIDNLLWPWILHVNY